MSQPQTRTPRPISNMPLNRKARRRLALTSALNNPLPIDVSVPTTASVVDTNAALLADPDRSAKSEPVLESTLSSVEPAFIAKHNKTASSASTASTKVGTSRNKKRKRQRLEDAQSGNAAADSSLRGEVAASSPPLATRPSGRDLASPTRVTANSLEAQSKPVFPPGPSIQQQMQERSRLLAAQEGNAKLEAQVKSLGEVIAAKSDVRALPSSVLLSLTLKICSYCPVTMTPWSASSRVSPAISVSNFSEIRMRMLSPLR